MAIDQSGTSIGFAIPINDAKPVIKSVREVGRIVRTRLGVRYFMLTPEIAEQYKLGKTQGAWISVNGDRADPVLDGSPADKAGLKPGDIIMEVNGIKGNLYEYQKLGVEFFLNSGGRALLADSPGVGKTVQALGFLTHTQYKRSLIVCPASVKFSWENEIDKWTNLSSFVVGPKTRLEDIPPDVNCIIVNYNKYFFPKY